MDVVTEGRSAVARGATRLLGTEGALRGWSVALLAANIVIIVTGAVVRLTGSGLGCPTWPRCTDASYVTTPEMGLHGVIEFTNRLLTFVLIAVALVTFVCTLAQPRDPSTRRDRRRMIMLTLVIGLGIPFQGVIGGITVRTNLNPYVVALHLLLSLALVVLSVRLVRRTHRLEPYPVVGGAARLPQVAFVLMGVTACLGTVLTGSGPHAGDASSPRTGLNPETMSHVHAIAVYATIAVTVITMVLLRSRAALLLLAVEVGQGVVGFVQYYNGLPVPVVALHLLGAALAIAAAGNLLFSYRRVPRT